MEIFKEYQRAAIHRRSYKRYDYNTTPAHMPDAHKSYYEQMGWDKAYFFKQAANIGAHTMQYIQPMIDSRQHKGQAYLGCVIILRIAGSNPPERIEAACRLALQSSSTSYKTIANILLNKGDLLLTTNLNCMVWPDVTTPSYINLLKHNRTPIAYPFCNHGRSRSCQSHHTKY